MLRVPVKMSQQISKQQMLKGTLVSRHHSSESKGTRQERKHSKDIQMVEKTVQVGNGKGILTKISTRQ